MTQMRVVAPFAFFGNNDRSVIFVKKSKNQIRQEGLSVQEVADYLHLSYSLAYKLTQQENFPCIRIGKRRVIPKRLLDQWLEEQARR